MVTQQITTLKEQINVNETKKMSIEEYFDKYLDELDKALPKDKSAKRLTRIAMTYIRLHPEIASCSAQSILGAIFQCAQLGLEPGVNGQAFLNAFWNTRIINGKKIKVKECQLMIGYQGFKELFYRHEKAITLDMQPVYEKDYFKYKYGTNAFLDHIPNEDEDRGKVTHYYSIAQLHGGYVFKVMTEKQCIEHGKKHSKCFDKTTETFKDGTPWATEKEAMCLKTVLKQLMKKLPLSTELQMAISMDDTTKSIIKQNMLEVKDETNWSENEENIQHAA